MKKPIHKIVFSKKDWSKWEWQQNNVVRDIRLLSGYFTKISQKYFDDLYNKSKNLKFQITPYILSQISRNISVEELEKNPWFLQFFPIGEIYRMGPDAYDGTENWDLAEEFPTSNIHHKYTNRALIRLRTCLSYCNFCFEALGTLEKKPKLEKLFKWSDWNKSLEYIAKHREIEEVILSGGEPLLLSDSMLDKIFKDLSRIKNVRFRRIHTRASTHNPFRITDNLVRIFKKYKVNEIAFDVAHPSEITSDFKDAVRKIRKGMGEDSPILVTHTPLVKNLNADAMVLWDLFAKLYELNVKPYYLIHSFPHTPFADQQRVSVRDGIRLVNKLKRHKSNIAIPEYIVAHYNGKITVPLEINGTPEFQYLKDNKNNPIIKFLNWKKKWVTYPDCKDTIKD